MFCRRHRSSPSRADVKNELLFFLSSLYMSSYRAHVGIWLYQFRHFDTLAKSVCLSVCISLSPVENIFAKFHIRDSPKSVQRIEIWLKSYKSIVHLHKVHFTLPAKRNRHKSALFKCNGIKYFDTQGTRHSVKFHVVIVHFFNFMSICYCLIYVCIYTAIYKCYFLKFLLNL
jgi:hypothetical protein